MHEFHQGMVIVSWNKKKKTTAILYLQIPKGERYTDKDIVSRVCAQTMAIVIVKLFVWFLFLPLSRELYLVCRISEWQKKQHG